MANMFDENGNYNKTEWKPGDRITAGKLNKIEESLEAINNNDIERHKEADERLDALEEQNEVVEERFDELEDLVADNKSEVDTAIYEVHSKMDRLEQEMNDGIDTVEAIAHTVDDKIAEADASMKAQVAEVEADLEGLHAKDEELSTQLDSITNINLMNYLVNGITINEAISIAQSNIDKGKIFIPNGEYEISDTIIINKEIYLDFAPEVTILNPFNNKTTIKINSNNVVVDGAHFVGCPDRTNVVYAITVSDNTSNVSIINNIINNYNGGIILISGNHGIQIDNNIFRNLLYPSESENTGGYGIVLQSSKNCRITNNIFDNVERHHIYMGRNPNKFELTGGNHIISNNIFLGVSQTEYFTGNEFLVKIMGNQNVSVTGNIFDGGVGHLWLTSSGTVNYHCENISITGNTFRNVEGVNYSTSCMIGSASDAENEYISEVVNCVITDNTLINCNSPQTMKFEKISNSIISSNTIKNCTEKGIVIVKGSLTTTISNNIIDGATRAIEVIGEDDYKEINIINNSITNSTFCLYINNIEFLYIKSNILKSIKYQPIYLYNCVFIHASITNNDIIGGNSGITITSGCSERILINDNHYYDQTVDHVTNQSSCLIFKVDNILGLRQNIEFYANEKPSSGIFKQGDICKIINPGEGNVWGYICTQGGNPGIWKRLGTIGTE